MTMTDVLSGIRVIEIGTMLTAPLASMMLADLGAEVMKIERPDGGDPLRAFGSGSSSPNFLAYNRNKKSVALDLKSPKARAVLERLLTGADVLIENFRPGVMERLGLGADAVAKLNSRLVHCSITGFGASGPYCDRPAYDAVGQALSGISSLSFDASEPCVTGPTIADNVTGMYACYGILGALFERARSGKGRRVEVNMLEAAIAFIPDPFANYAQLGVANTPITRAASSQSFAFRCADRKLIALHLSSQEKFWTQLLSAIGDPVLASDARFASRELRVAGYVDLRATLAGIFQRRPRAEWVASLEAAGVPYAPINTIAEVMDDPQVCHLGLFERIAGAGGAWMTVQTCPVLIDHTRGRNYWPPPNLGEHTRPVLLGLGYSEEEVSNLTAQRGDVIG
jgi:crotonobetainyl-CoA:carnitine CoA-transferase CaiB-like acyl-CoA transferase